MLGLIGKKRHEAELLRVQLQAEASKKEAWARTQQAGEEKEAAEARCKAAEAECARIMACHATRVRVASILIDPAVMTARIRAIEPSLRCEWDGSKMVCYSDRPLTEGEVNAVISEMTPRVDRT